MSTIYDLTATQACAYSSPHTGLTTWATQRQLQSGTVKVKLDDVTITQGDGIGGRWDVKFDYLDYRIGLYKRGTAAGQVHIKTIRKHWNVNPGWVTLGNIGGGYYSLQTQFVAFYRDGTKMSLGGGPNPWVTSLFDLSHGG